MTPALTFGGRIVVYILLYLILTGRCFGEDEKIVKITILGNEKVAEDVIRSNVKSKENAALSIPQVKRDLKAIYDMGFFSDVIIDLRDVEGGKEVIFIVVEKPSIRNIRISGNEKISSALSGGKPGRHRVRHHGGEKGLHQEGSNPRQRALLGAEAPELHEDEEEGVVLVDF
jgi:hypothetical protein